MKHLYSLSLLLLLFASCGKDDSKTIENENPDWEFYKLKGKVESVSEKSFETFDGKTKGASKHEILSDHDRDLLFDDKGQLLSEKTYSGGTNLFEDIKYKGKAHKLTHLQYNSGNPSIKTEYVWDKQDKNNLAIIRRNADNSLFDKVVFKYKSNRLIERIAYDAQENQVNRIKYEFDKNGNTIAELHFGTSEVIEHKTEYKYNENNQKVNETHYNKEGKTDYTTIYQYNGDLLISAETSNGKGEVSYIEKNEYDKNGNLTSHYVFDKFEGVPTNEEYTYDTEGNRIQWTSYRNEKVTLKAAYTYDDHNNMTKALTVDGDGNVIESKLYNYEYDKQGNWIRKIFINQDRPSIITERTITYFK